MASNDWVHVGGDGTGKDRAFVGRNEATGEVRVSVTAHVLTWDAEAAARIAELIQRAAMPGQRAEPPATELAAAVPPSPREQARKDARGMWNAALGHDPY